MRLFSFILPHLVFLVLLCFPGGVRPEEARAVDKEERVPQGAAFNSDATLVVYEDAITPPGAVLPTTSEIWTVFSDGKGKMRLTSGHKDLHPHFSPDGKQIIFERDNDGEIWMIPTNGGEVRNLTNTPQVFEHGAQFSNDGDHLYFLAPKPLTPTEVEAIAKDPMMALGISDALVEFSLKDGTRRQILSDDYRARAVLPDPNDDNAVIALSNALDPAGHPLAFADTILLSVPLAGGVPRTLYSPPKDYALEKAWAGEGYLALSSSAPGKYGAQAFLLKRSAAATNPALATDLQPLEHLTFLGDISCEGKLLIGTTTGLDDKTARFYHRLEIYDIASGKWRTVFEE